MRQVLPLMVLLPLWTSVGLAAEVEVLFDGKDALAWSPMRDAQRLHRELSLHEIKQLTDPPALSWRFVPKSVNFNDLFLRRPIDSLFEAVRVRVRNEASSLAWNTTWTWPASK